MSNPLLNDRVFEGASRRGAGEAGWAAPQRSSGTSTWAPPVTDGPVSAWTPAGAVMTARGAMSATLMLAVVMLAAAVVGWGQVATSPDGTVALPGWLFAAAIGGMVAALVATFKPAWARVLAPVYAVLQGLVVGAISKVYNVAYDGIVLQAVGATMGVFLVMLALYRTRVLRVTSTFRRVIVGATLGIMVFYLVALVASLFGAEIVPSGSGAFSIGFSLVVAAIAAFNLALDFDFIEQAERAGAPKHMEWFAALGLLVTIVWLYLEILRLLAKLRDR
ncbi:MAG: Bax inhibitor-1/YccA family protein [Acidobacteria bacterium]|nr:Bax inhibitor-1/YccA family protein [Acidobacteriota bacterium]